MTMDLPIACSLEEQEKQSRVAAWEALLADALIGRKATAGGVRLVLRASSETQRQLDELIGLESKCCAWMAFDVTDERDLTVDITAGDELGRKAVRELFLTGPLA